MARPTSLGGLGKREKTLEVERSLHGQSHVSLGSGVAEPAGGGGVTKGCMHAPLILFYCKSPSCIPGAEQKAGLASDHFGDFFKIPVIQFKKLLYLSQDQADRHGDNILLQ